VKLYIVRHGEAHPRSVDPNRPLTARGIAETKRIAHFLKNAHMEVDMIFHSTKKRAQETAVILKKGLRLDCPMQAKDYLAPDDLPDKVYNEILESRKNVMIVGHLPFLDRLVSRFLDEDEAHHIVKFKESTIAILEQDVPPQWRIASYISPDILGG